MKMRLLVSALTLGVIVGANLPSQASTMTFGKFDGGSYNKHFGDDNVSGLFTDDYNFSLTGAAEISASITNSYTSLTGPIGGFTLTLFSGTSASLETVLKTVLASDVPSANFQFGGFAGSEVAGDYFLEVTGTATSASYGGSLALNVSAVPLPPALPMFGAALLATLGLGYGLKRSRTEKAMSAV